MADRERHKREIGRMEFFSQGLALCVAEPLLWGTAEKLAGGMFWLPVLAAAVAGLFWPLLLLLWSRQFAGLSFGEALCYGFGRAGGRVLLFAYAGFWLVLAGLALDCGVSFWSSLGANNAPLWLYAASYLLSAAAFAAAGGVPLARVSLLVVTPALLLALANLGLTVFGADFGNWLPAWRQGRGAELGLAGLGLGVLAFGGLSALLPELKQVRAVKQRWRTCLGALLAAAVLWLALSGVSLAVLGESVMLYDFPVLQVFRLAEVGHWFSRFEVIGAVLLQGVALLRLSALLAASASCLQELWQWPRKGGWQRFLLSLGLGAALLLAYLAGAKVDLVWLLGLLAAFAMGAPLLAVWAGGRRLRRESRTVLVRHDNE